MRAGYAEIAGQLVSVEDPRIQDFTDSVYAERGLYEIRADRGLRANVADNHAHRLAGISQSLIEGFQIEQDDGSTKYVLGAVEDELVKLCIAKPGPAAEGFLDAQTYVRTSRLLAEEYGPDRSPSFDILRDITLGAADEVKNFSIEASSSEPLGWNFSINLMNGLVSTVASRRHPYDDELRDRIVEQGLILSGLQQKPPEDDEPAYVEYFDLDNDSFEEVDPELEEKFEDEIAVDDSLSENVDLAVIRLVSRLDYIRSEFLHDFSQETILTILTVGGVVLRSKHPRREDGAGLGLYSNGAVDWSRAACREPSSGEYSVETFFPKRGVSVAYAKAICDTCSIKGKCLNFAIQNGIEHGIWGGESERARRKIRKSLSE